MFTLYFANVLAHAAFVYVDWALLYVIFTDTILHHLILILIILYLFFMRLFRVWVILSLLEIIAWVIIITPCLQWTQMNTTGICSLLYSHIRLWNNRLLVGWIYLFRWRFLFGDIWVIICRIWLSVLLIEFIFVLQERVILLRLFRIRVFLFDE